MVTYNKYTHTKKHNTNPANNMSALRQHVTKHQFSVFPSEVPNTNLLQICFIHTPQKSCPIKGELIFLNESNTQQKLQKTEQCMQIDPEGALWKMSSCKQN